MHVGCVAVGGTLIPAAGLNLQIPAQELKWPSLHST